MNFKNHLVFQINMLNRKLTAKTNRILSDSGLETSSFFLLCYLSECDVYGSGSLEGTLQMERSTLSRSFSVLAKNGYCLSVKGFPDGRIWSHKITDRGRNLIDSYTKRLDDLEDSFLEDKMLLALSGVFKNVG